MGRWVGGSGCGGMGRWGMSAYVGAQAVRFWAGG